MGLFDDKNKINAILQKSKIYPSCVIDLNIGDVQKIFNDCLSTNSTPNTDKKLSILFKKAFGYEKDSNPIVFCKSKILQYKPAILFLLGQLKSVHDNKGLVTSQSSIYKYNNTKWTQDTATMMELYHLAEAADLMTPFVKKTNSAPLLVQLPTISPKDPNFPAWWEEHKSEWEDKRKKGGQEPADE